MIKKYSALIFTLALSSISLNTYAYNNSEVSIATHIAPGVFGKVDIGSRPPPPLVYEKPVIVYHRSEYVAPPVYMYVPPQEYQSWNRHCHKYDACNRKVYFVQPSYYERNNEWRHNRHHYWRERDRIRMEEGRDRIENERRHERWENHHKWER